MASTLQTSPLPPRQPELAALYAHWRALAGVAPMPPRRSLDPVGLRRWLGNLVLVEVLDGGADFLYRVHGTTLAQRMGLDLTGKLLSEANSPFTPKVRAEYAEVLRLRAPVLVERSSFLPKPFMSFDKLSLPLSNEAGDVGSIVAGIYASSD